MPSDVEICNIALRELGDYSITSLVEESKAARLCKVLYEPSVLELLRDHPWRFARRRAILAPAAGAIGTPEFEWAYRCPLPSGCVRVFKVGEGGEVDYTLEGRYLLTDSDAPKIYYVMRVDESEFDSMFVTALALRMAQRLCMPLTDNATQLGEITKLAMNAKAEARTVSALEAPPEPERESVWLESRI